MKRSEALEIQVYRNAPIAARVADGAWMGLMLIAILVLALIGAITTLGWCRRGARGIGLWLLDAKARKEVRDSDAQTDVEAPSLTEIFVTAGPDGYRWHRNPLCVRGLRSKTPCRVCAGA